MLVTSWPSDDRPELRLPVRLTRCGHDSTASLLRGFVVILYDKAVLEPNFIGMYAQMCERLAKVRALTSV